jgi:hypothetical protein
MSSRAARVGRGLAAAGFATFIAALFHVAGGGLPPSALALVLSLVFSGLGCIVLAGKRTALWRTAASVVLSQFLFHGLFSLSPSGHFAGPTGHVHAGSQLVLVPGSTENHAGMVHDSGAMWISHVCAALLTIVVIRYGAQTLRTVCTFAAFHLRGLLVAFVPVSVPVPRVRVATASLAVAWHVILQSGLRRRGPPAMGGLA